MVNLKIMASKNWVKIAIFDKCTQDSEFLSYSSFTDDLQAPKSLVTVFTNMLVRV